MDWIVVKEVPVLLTSLVADASAALDEEAAVA